MISYKNDVTLNEKDSLTDLLMAEDSLLMAYADALTDGVSKGFCGKIKQCLSDVSDDRLNVFLLLTEKDYARVESANAEILSRVNRNFAKARTELS